MRLFLIIISIFSALTVSAQKVKEADFVGNVRAFMPDSSIVNLDKTNVQIKTKATGSKIWWGIGSSKAFVEDEKFRETYKYECMRRFSLSLDATVDKSLAEFSDCDDYYEYFIENFDAEGFVKSHPEFS